MAVLLLRLAAPLQAWGADAKFETRRTEREPTKSGVIGLLAAALGIRRGEGEKLRSLNALGFGVRADREGELLVDYHTAKTADGKSRYITYRHYLSDAVFLVGLESAQEDRLAELQTALEHPVFPLFLGRRACPPTLPLCLGVRQTDLLTALQTEPPLVSSPPQKLRITLDADPREKGAAFRHDLPLSLSPVHRQHGYRAARETFCTPCVVQNETAHDPFAELG